MSSEQSIPSPVALNHVGVGVADIDAAIAWYCEILGARLVSGPFEIADDAQAEDVLGSRFRRMLLAHLSLANGVGIELFQSIDPPHQRRRDSIDFWKSGFFHICVTHPDVEGLAERIASTGGKRLSRIWKERGDAKDYRMCYCRDPFGNIIEIYSHSYELMQAHR